MRIMPTSSPLPVPRTQAGVPPRSSTHCLISSCLVRGLADDELRFAIVVPPSLALSACLGCVADGAGYRQRETLPRRHIQEWTQPTNGRYAVLSGAARRTRVGRVVPGAW